MMMDGGSIEQAPKIGDNSTGLFSLFLFIYFVKICFVSFCVCFSRK
jgi:hypothetical protein